MKLGVWLVVASILWLSVGFTLSASQNGEVNLNLRLGGTDESFREIMRDKVLGDFSESGSGSESGLGDEAPNDTENSGEGESGSGEVLVANTKAPQKTTKPRTPVEDTTPKVIYINTNPRKSTIGNDIVHVKTHTLGNEAHVARPADSREVKKKGSNLILGIIVGVVVGALLALLIILFLVYRLRKKDEGSYVLDDQSSQFLKAKDERKSSDEYFA